MHGICVWRVLQRVAEEEATRAVMGGECADVWSYLQAKVVARGGTSSGSWGRAFVGKPT